MEVAGITVMAVMAVWGVGDLAYMTIVDFRRKRAEKKARREENHEANR